eukprot:TRINITY_DN14249_c0_g2_i1.p1 TRINITY_DN14249_c0_g2~~TRINITY_DN14249_c0_g2_i1.p1  ORF type:complete len:371 (+),score=56.62 TRINITY_DN14249_c0_g2_i1:82-1194(+)
MPGKKEPSFVHLQLRQPGIGKKSPAVCGSTVSRRTIVKSKHERYWLPNWIALHAERGQVRKCWEGHRLRSESQDGRVYGSCQKCGQTPPAGARILACRTCCWAVCEQCSKRPRLPSLDDDPLFRAGGPSMLALPGHEEQQYRGTVIVCPGGNYEFLCPNEGLPVVEWLAKHGIRGLVLRYRLLPKHDHAAAIEDLTTAVGVARRLSRGGPVAAIGFSAGGHLVASFGIEMRRRAAQRRAAGKNAKSDLKLDAQVLVYPAIDGAEWADADCCGFWDWRCTKAVPSLVANRRALLGGHGFAASPTFLVASTGDSVCAPRDHSDLYAAALERRGKPCTYVRRNFGEHGFALNDGWTRQCIKWLQSRGFGDESC